MKHEPHVPSELEKKLELSSHLPSLRTLVVSISLVSAAVLLVWPLSAASRRGSLTGGPVTNHHRLVEPACEQCHQKPFRAVTDSQCVACHQVHAHASAVPSLVAAHPELGARCASCHKEHHGEQSLIPSDSPLCTACHKQMDRLVPASRQPGVGDFAHHPELAVRAWADLPPVLRKARLDEPGVRDPSQIKFSHAEHLGQVGADGKPAFACASCHRSAADGSVQPISYALDCERCHSIVVEKRLSHTYVPHGDEERAMIFVGAQLARLHVDKDIPATPELLEKETHDAELNLFTAGGACLKCHDVEEGGRSPAAGHSHFHVATPNVPAKWMPAAKFGHAAHRLTACETCHAGARESTSAGDILLPGIAQCRECHADPGTPGKVESPCLECHDYHAPL